MDGRDSEVRPDAGIDADGLSFDVQPDAAKAMGQRGAPAGYFIERPMVGYRFAVAGANRSSDGHEWRPTLRWAKAAARRRMRQAR